MKKEFKGLLKSEIRKAERLANKTLETDDCKVTGYFTSGERSLEYCPDIKFVYVKCEICHNYKERADVDIWLDIPMFDRRRTFATLTALE